MGPQSMIRSLADFGSINIVYCWSVATVLVISPIIGFVLGDKEEAHTTRERSANYLNCEHPYAACKGKCFSSAKFTPGIRFDSYRSR